MFKKARLKLTFWYIGILLLVSSIFSGLIYQRVSIDIEKGFHRGMMRMEDLPLNIQKDHRPPRFVQDQFFLQDIKLAKQNLLYSILMINGIILLISGFGSYYLAGKTLEPIQITLDKQKRFIADAAHELKTPITALKTSLEVNLLDKKMSKEFRKILQENLDDVSALQKLSENLLQLASWESRQYKFSQFDLSKLVTKAIKSLKPLSAEKQQKITFVNNGSSFIKADKDSIYSLILILLENAIKYTDKKGIIEIKISKSTRKVILSIKDNGIGIAKKDLAYIFERFYQSESSRSKKISTGFGLGLSMAKEIAQKNNLKIYATSTLKKGSEFSVEFKV